MADRYWVGGGSSTSWNATGPTNWSGTSGGSNDASVPTSVDTVYFDENSGTGNSVISASISIGTLVCSGYTGTLTHNVNVAVTLGSGFLQFRLLLPNTMTYTKGNDFTSSFTFSGTSNGNIIVDVDGHSLGNVTLSRTLGLLLLRNDLELSGIFTHTRGTLALGGYSFSCDRYSSSNTNARVITGGGNINSLGLDGGFNNYFGYINGGTDVTSELKQQVAQSFTAASDTVYGCSVYLSKSGSPTDNVTVELVSTLGGSVIASKTIASSSLTADTFNDFVFDTLATVTPNNTYYLVFSRSGTRDETNRWALRANVAVSTFVGGIYEQDNTVWDSGASFDSMISVLEEVPINITITGDGSAWNFSTSTNASFWGNVSVVLTDSTSTEKVFSGGGLSYHKLHNNTTGSGAVRLANFNTFGTLEIDAGRTTLFDNGTTQTITTLNIGDGSILRSSSNGNTYTLSVPSGTVEVDDATIRDSIATGGATFRALHSVNEGNNTGWTFIDAPTVVTSSPQTIATYNALGLANITDDAGYTLIRRGFVWSTTSYADPGNVEPSASSYSNVTEETGTYTEGEFTRSLFSLDRFITYHYRGFAEHSEGVIGYGNEVAFTTVKNGIDVVNNPLSNATPINQTTTTSSLSQPSVNTVSPVNETTTTSGIINQTTNNTTINGT